MGSGGGSIAELLLAVTDYSNFIALMKSFKAEQWEESSDEEEKQHNKGLIIIKLPDGAEVKCPTPGCGKTLI